MSRQPWDPTENDRHSARAKELSVALTRLNRSFKATVAMGVMGGVMALFGSRVLVDLGGRESWVTAGLGVLGASVLLTIGLLVWCFLLLRAAQKIPTRAERELEANAKK